MHILKLLSITFLLAFLIFGTIGGCGGGDDTSGQTRKVIVNIWDGSEWTKIKPLFDSGQLPNAESVGPVLQLTCNEDCFEDPCGCMKSVTKAQHATMLTGVLADSHGVFTNECFKGLIPKGLTVYEQIEIQNPATKTAHLSSKPIQFGELIFGNIVDGSFPDVDVWFASAVEQPVITNEAIKLIENWSNMDFFIVVHWRQPDIAGHNFGINSQVYTDELLENDSELGKILDALEEQGIADQTKIYIISDHGFGCPSPTGHNCSPNTFILSNDNNLNTDIFMVDVAGFLLSNFGL